MSSPVQKNINRTGNYLRVTSSFRDPSGFLFWHEDGTLYRQVNTVYRANYDCLLASGLYDALLSSVLLIPHQEVTIVAPQPEFAYKIIQPQLVPFISYPYEWCFSQLKDAALTTLKIQRKSLDHGMTLKDCSAYNIQFMRGKPIFIDTLSFEKYEEGKPWVAYRQFCQHFLAPLALMSHKDIRLSQLLRIYIDGIPLDLASSILPGRTHLSFSLLAHIHLHARSQARYADKPVAMSGRKLSRLGFLGIIDSLESAIRKLKWQPRGTEWAEYYRDTNYTAEAFEHKKRVVADYLDRIKPESVWDLGGNVGTFSRIASERGAFTLSFDNDPAAIENNYLDCLSRGEPNILPLVVDLTNPSPGIGWENSERMSLSQRGPADIVLALALVHHLAISNNVPLDRIASFLRNIGKSLIIEFVPKTDSQVQRLLATRNDIFTDYTKQGFEKAFDRYFVIEDSVSIRDSARTLYLMNIRKV